jgi:murein DD-endopeptidase MepM/ murein hydrolase activator NlpD
MSPHRTAPPARAARQRSRASVLLAVLLSACGGFGGSRPNASPAPGASLVIPVQGVRAEELRDTYDDARDGGRTHHAIDIMARRGTPVLAAADGRVLKLRSNGLGGITVYQVGPDGRTLYYYAHLSGYARGLREGKEVRRGEVIAYVGDTGNAGRGNYHLHFSVGRLNDPHRWWESENVDPYPLLAGDVAWRQPRRGASRD